MEPLKRKFKNDLVGRRFGKLIALEVVDVNKDGDAMWFCKCDCGNTTTLTRACLVKEKNHVRSCGCLHHPYGKGVKPLLSIWHGMKRRCEKKDERSYVRYGGRGITVCARWQDFLVFQEDLIKGYELHKSKNEHTYLDRIDNDKGYSPENCRWANAKESMQNTSFNRWITYKGEKKVLSEWGRIVGRSPTIIRDRLSKGWPVKDALYGSNHLINPHKRMIRFQGSTLSLTDWATKIGISVSSLHQRLSRGSVERALTTPSRYAK